MRHLREGDLPIAVGLATDVGGGSSFSMFETMKAAYEISQLRGYSLHPAKAFYLATVGSANVLRLGHRVGNLAAGHGCRHRRARSGDRGRSWPSACSVPRVSGRPSSSR